MWPIFVFLAGFFCVLSLLDVFDVFISPFGNELFARMFLIVFLVHTPQWIAQRYLVYCVRNGLLRTYVGLGGLMSTV
jgi:hypothetical protein